jgi:hypothetical protein
MYWSGCQSTGADMRKYLTAAVSVGRTRSQCTPLRSNARLEWDMSEARTVVDLLKCDDTVRWEALLSVLI